MGGGLLYRPYDIHGSLLTEGIASVPDVTPVSQSVSRPLCCFLKHGLEDSADTHFQNLPRSYLAAQSLHCPVLALRRFPAAQTDEGSAFSNQSFFVFVTVGQLNLNRSVLALCSCTLD